MSVGTSGRAAAVKRMGAPVSGASIRTLLLPVPAESPRVQVTLALPLLSVESVTAAELLLRRPLPRMILKVTG